MTMTLTLVLFVIFFACVACLYTEGMWGNAIRLINVVTSALLATSLWEPAARWLDGWNDSFTYLWDFLTLWGLFVIFMIVFRLATDFLSKVKVRFLTLADRIGGAILSVWIGWVMVCFTLMTMHTAPLARNFMWEGFQPEQQMFFGLAPDRKWLGFTQKMSLGSFCRSGTQKGTSERTVFDPKAEFMPKYATRRAELESHNRTTGTLRVRKK